jgi:hypothetical protein
LNLELDAALNSPRAIAIHLRRGDYVNNPNYELTKYEYFIRTSKKIRYEFGNDLKVYIFSDDKRSAENLSKFIPNSTVFNDQNLSPLEVMYNMSFLQFTICSNSTFSWWAAFLNDNQNRFVFFPSNWFGSKKEDISRITFSDVEVI